MRWGCDVLRAVYDETTGQDGRVSIEVDPRLAHRTDATIAEARALWWLVDRPNVMIKIPATHEGLGAITAATSEGISVNVTLIFSLDRYQAVMDAYLAGLEQAHSKDVDLSTIRSVASFFVSRVDTEVDKRLDAIDDPNHREEATALRSKAAVANARLAYQQFEEVFSSDRVERPARRGRSPATPAVGVDVGEGPEAPRHDVRHGAGRPRHGQHHAGSDHRGHADHGEIVAGTIASNYDDAQDVLDRLEKLGISYDDVVQVVEDEGVDKFEKSWEELLDTVRQALGEATA